METKSTNGASRNQLNIEKIERYYDQAYNAIARAEDCVLLTAQGYRTESESVEGTAQVEGRILWVWTVECLVCTGAREE